MNIPTSYFDALYTASDDPWNVTSSAYEKNKYTDTLMALPDASLNVILECGCGIGVLSRLLAARCQFLVAVDTSAVAIAAARDRCADIGNISFRQGTLPDDWPRISCDAIILSEILYYLDRKSIAAMADRCLASLTESGIVILVNFLGPTSACCNGNEAVASFAAFSASRLMVIKSIQRGKYRLDVFARSVQ